MADLAITTRVPEEEKPKNDSEFLFQVVKRFQRAESVESENRMNAIDDLQFKNGDQWPEGIRAQRTVERRPCLTINKMKTFVHQITNDQRQNRPSINVSPVGDKSDPMTAKMFKGLIKQIERSSKADIAYDTGFDSAVTMGWGYWRILPEYESDGSFNQVLKVGRIRNPFRVYLDPDHQEPDGSDAQWGFITDLIVRTEFKENWPEADPIEWQETGLGDGFEHWSTLTHIRIAEYFCYETEKRKLLALNNGHIGYYDALADDLKADVDSGRVEIVKEREVQVKTVKWYTLTAKEILEETDWLGKWIPIIKVIGDEIDVEGKNYLSGLVRDAKDPQRMYNFWVTSETELIALAPKAPWVIEEGQIEGHEREWNTANTKSHPYLQYKGTSIAGKPSPPPQRQQFAGPPQGIVAAKIAAAQDMQATTGIRFDATMQERMYDESGKALRELKRVGDLGNFHYVDNLSRSLRFTGMQLVDAIPKYYDTKRVLVILREDDSEETVEIDPNQGKSYENKAAGGMMRGFFNPKIGEFGVTVTIGPSFATKRAEAADSMLAFMKAVPNSGPLIGDLIAKNMDWPGADEIAVRLQAMLPPQVLNKNLDRLQPEAKGLVMNLMQQVQQLTQQRDQAAAMLGSEDKDRQIEQDKINKDYEAKLAKITSDMQLGFAKLGSEANDPIAELGLKVKEIEANLQAQIYKIDKEHEIKRAEQAMDAELAQQDHALKRDVAASDQQLKRDNAEADQAIAKQTAKKKE